MTATAPHPQSTTPAARRAAGLATTVLAIHGREAVEEITPAAFAWQSPFELARSLATYEVMGWGGELIHNPDTAVDLVDSAAIEKAVEGLVRPIKEVMGRS